MNEVGYVARTLKPNLSYHHLKYPVCVAKIKLIHYAVRAAYRRQAFRSVERLNGLVHVELRDPARNCGEKADAGAEADGVARFAAA